MIVSYLFTYNTTHQLKDTICLKTYITSSLYYFSLYVCKSFLVSFFILNQNKNKFPSNQSVFVVFVVDILDCKYVYFCFCFCFFFTFCTRRSSFSCKLHVFFFYICVCLFCVCVVYFFTFFSSSALCLSVYKKPTETNNELSNTTNQENI